MQRLSYAGLFHSYLTRLEINDVVGEFIYGPTLQSRSQAPAWECITEALPRQQHLEAEPLTWHSLVEPGNESKDLGVGLTPY